MSARFLGYYVLSEKRTKEVPEKHSKRFHYYYSMYCYNYYYYHYYYYRRRGHVRAGCASGMYVLPLALNA